MSARALVSLLVVFSFAPLFAWKSPTKSESLNAPIFGTHDWVAFKGYVLAGRPAFIANHLNRVFIGTEAPTTASSLRTRKDPTGAAVRAIHRTQGRRHSLEAQDVAVVLTRSMAVRSALDVQEQVVEVEVNDPGREKLLDPTPGIENRGDEPMDAPMRECLGSVSQDLRSLLLHAANSSHANLIAGNKAVCSVRFSINANAPAAIAAGLTTGSSAVTTMVLVRGSVRVSSRHASMPFLFGMFTSRRMTSGCNRAASSSTRAPSSTLPTTA